MLTLQSVNASHFQRQIRFSSIRYQLDPANIILYIKDRYTHYKFFFSHRSGLAAKIGNYRGFERISYKELDLFPPFLRFKRVWLSYDQIRCLQPIDKKCDLFVKHLKPLKAAINASTMIRFTANISADPSHFRDPPQLLNHLCNELLPCCDSARYYDFRISFYSHEASAPNILASILQVPSVNSSTNVEFNFLGTHVPCLLPVDVISAWLNRSSDTMAIKGQHQMELSIFMRGNQNGQEMIDHLKKVYFATFNSMHF